MRSGLGRFGLCPPKFSSVARQLCQSKAAAAKAEQSRQAAPRERIRFAPPLSAPRRWIHTWGCVKLGTMRRAVRLARLIYIFFFWVQIRSPSSCAWRVGTVSSPPGTEAAPRALFGERKTGIFGRAGSRGLSISESFSVRDAVTTSSQILQPGDAFFSPDWKGSHRGHPRPPATTSVRYKVCQRRCRCHKLFTLSHIC